MTNIPGSDNLQNLLSTLRPAQERIETLIKHFDEGTPVSLSAEHMDFHNGLQVISATQHIVCKHADFALAKRFMTENPNHKGFHFRVT